MTAGLPGTRRPDTKRSQRGLAAFLMLMMALPARAYDVYAAQPLHDNDPAPVEIVLTEESDSPPEEALAQEAASPALENALAQDAQAARSDSVAPEAVDQVIYKGVVGNLLEAFPLEPEQRVELQRGNAIIGNAFAGRSLALLLGIASPPLMIAGLVWGIWSAMQIKPARSAVVEAPPSAPAEVAVAQAAEPPEKDAVQSVAVVMEVPFEDDL